MLDFTNTHFSRDRKFTDYTKVQTVVSTVIRSRRVFAASLPEGAYLNIGCGPVFRPGFHHLDYHWMPGIDLCWDVTKGLPVKDRWLDGIFTEHCVEHISIESWYSLAGHFRRVLKPGRVARIVVPDGKLYCERYLAKQPMPYGDTDATHNIYTPMMSINRIMRAHGHQFIYDFETMRAVLADAGFQNITQRAFGVGSDARLLIDTPEREVESLYVEATA